MWSEITSHYCKLGMSFWGIILFMLHFVRMVKFRPEWRRENVLVKEEDRVKEGELENGSLCFSPGRFFVKPIHFFKIGYNVLKVNML